MTPGGLFLLRCISIWILAADPEYAPYDAESGRWLVDPQAIVSRNDVLYTTVSAQPWEAMPTGGGDLSAMVRFDGDLHLHLTKSDAWGFQTPPDALPGSRFFNNVSPGHIRIALGPKTKDLASRFFRQRLDLYQGRVVIELGSQQTPARLEIWGHPRRKILIVEVSDPQRLLGPTMIELTEWRPTMNVGHASTTLTASEIHTRAARPHLANAGMQDYFDAKSDPLLGRGTAVALATPSVSPPKCSSGNMAATMVLPDACPPSYHVVIAAAVTVSGDPLGVAQGELSGAASVSLDTLKAEHRSWWRDYWSRSFLRLQSADRTAEWLVAAWHVHLYTLACVNRGPYPAKWDGGPGLMRGDERTWGLAEWVQEIRFTYMPLYAANQLEIAKGLPDHYSRMLPYLTEQTRKMWGTGGLWIPETVLPWGHAEDFVLTDDGRGAAGDHFQAWDPKTAPYGRFQRYNPYVGFLFTVGLEICHHYLTWYRYTKDETFLRDQAYPVLRGVCEFLAHLLRKGPDGRYHLDPANALETWWMVRDPADTLAGIRAIFPEFIRLADRYKRDADLRTTCAAILTGLADAPRGYWAEDGRIDPAADVYAPAAAIGKFPKRCNAENPALYRVFPFGLSGIGTDDYELARRTFDRRICVLGNGWSMDPIWAARLGLADQAAALLVQHARQFNRFRYGGWDSNDSNVFPGGLSAAPFMDAAGLSAFALNEILLQSHNGRIRIAPAVPKSWSGIFRLRAEGAFLVAADIQNGRVRFVEIQSLLGNDCTIVNPWHSMCVVSEGRVEVLRTDAETVVFKTRPACTYTLGPADKPLASYRVLPIQDRPNQSPGLPGRD